MPQAVLWLLASYFVGAIPTSYLLSRLFAGIDLRKHGSGNLGATNLYRVLGWKYAIPAAAVDIAKGAIPVLVFAPQVSDSQLFALGCGVAAILGHVFSVFVGFKGGKGVATAAGVMLGLTPIALTVAAVVWALLVRITGYVSVASIAAAAVLPVAVYLLEDSTSPGLLWIATAIAAGVILLHRRNIQRLLKGTESRFGRKAASAPQP
ncbi:MAG: acyl phosphate:glycerol-3-phosphate acyltransferase [Gemmatimonadales bacterium]|jgi:glycerol-3-phosphate acyltransferase PlsY|nr:acyl phosphate:glycerol-3-phosphate acyltransferase [Gemmatimonadales bacterium]